MIRIFLYFNKTMNNTMANFLNLRYSKPEGVPTGDVLKSYYEPWKTNTQPVVRIKKKNILLLEQPNNGKEFIFNTPPVEIQDCNINNIRRKKHILRISKKWPPKWTLKSKSLPYNFPEEPDKWFKELEKIAKQCLKIAFDNPDIFIEATSLAWERVNMESETAHIDAWNNFLLSANMPYDEYSWLLKKNTTKGKNNQFITIVDIANMEHTGNVTLSKGGIISVAIRLWPYHMNKNCYGISATISDAGIKMYHKGGFVLPRNTIKINQTCIVKAGSKINIYDVFGGFYKFHARGKVTKDGIFKYTNQYSQILSILFEHFKKNGITVEEEILIQDWDKYKYNDDIYEGNVALECHVEKNKLTYKLKDMD